MTSQKQEVRSMLVAFRVTPSEKLRMEWVAGCKGTDVSTLLREMSVSDILAEHKRLSSAVSAVV